MYKFNPLSDKIINKFGDRQIRNQSLILHVAPNLYHLHPFAPLLHLCGDGLYPISSGHGNPPEESLLKHGILGIVNAGT